MVHRHDKIALGLTVLVGLGLSCQPDIPFHEGEELAPLGVIEGNLTYRGPLPCTQNGHVLGAAVMLVFESDGLPPPEGLSPSLANFATVAGDDLFHDVIDQLPSNADGSRACPPPGTEVLVSAPFAISPLEAGSYQIRSFYDYDGDFYPVFSYSNLPTKGDVSGGAIINPGQFLEGERPNYRDIVIGDQAADGTIVMPSTGVRLRNVTVTLAQPYTLQRPYLHYAGVQDPLYDNTDPGRVVIPADYWLGNLLDLELGWMKVVMGPGVPEAEREAAMAPPFGFHIDDPGKFVIYAYDSDGDGEPETIPEGLPVPALMPQVLWTKSERNDPTGYDTQGSPTVALLGLTLANNLAGTLGATEERKEYEQLVVGLRPAAICIDSSESPPQVTLVTPHVNTRAGASLLGDDTGAILAGLASLTGTTPDRAELVYACLPPGQYGVNVIYSSGQVWSVPNEAGVCMTREDPSDAPIAGGLPMCGIRPRLPSQGQTLLIGPPKHVNDPELPGYDCYTFESDAKRERYKQTCLTEAERVLLDNQELF